MTREEWARADKSVGTRYYVPDSSGKMKPGRVTSAYKNAATLRINEDVDAGIDRYGYFPCEMIYFNETDVIPPKKPIEIYVDTRIICTTTNKIYKSMTEAAEKEQVTRRALGEVLDGKHKTTQKKRFMYYEEYQEQQKRAEG